MSLPGISQEDAEAVQAIVRDAGTSFYQGMRILPPDRRLAMYAVYAFCRLVDDVADEPAELAPQARRVGHAGARKSAPFLQAAVMTR